ncbi:Zf-DNL-domain-containing protein [Paragonimus heterotremus]|uniref:Zf-DNL-domain-containing protein n=1 Tax=Paragonimus heterotremus TaxID=100268 RepID=A0A8J4SJ47_9TREM|nr:Zf-DNL-domain-containing protein [Paragonimus heterotremus]
MLLPYVRTVFSRRFSTVAHRLQTFPRPLTVFSQFYKRVYLPVNLPRTLYSSLPVPPTCLPIAINSPTTDHDQEVKSKMYIEFTCKKCNHRSKKYFSKQAYQKGIVIIRCDGCENLHLIADNLGWIKDGHWKIEDAVKVDYKTVCVA